MTPPRRSSRLGRRSVAGGGLLAIGSKQRATSELRFYIGRGEAVGLIALDDAEPIYADEDGLASLLGTAD